jgi:hypothetical protein
MLIPTGERSHPRLAWLVRFLLAVLLLLTLALVAKLLAGPLFPA